MSTGFEEAVTFYCSSREPILRSLASVSHRMGADYLIDLW